MLQCTAELCFYSLNIFKFLSWDYSLSLYDCKAVVLYYALHFIFINSRCIVAGSVPD